MFLSRASIGQVRMNELSLEFVIVNGNGLLSQRHQAEDMS